MLPLLAAQSAGAQLAAKSALASQGGGGGLSMSKAMSLGGRALQGYGNAMGAYTDYQAKVLGYKTLARTKRTQSQQTRQRTIDQAHLDDQQASRLLGSQRQAFAVKGVELSDTAIDVMAETMKQLTTDKVMAIRNGQQEEEVLNAESRDADRAAKMARKTGRLQTGLAVAGMFL